MPPGRPRGFDIDQALDRALELFWERGFDGTSMSDLRAATGLASASLYAAFGDKRGLFAAALRRYRERGGDYASRALDEEPTARAAVGRMLRDAARFFTAADHPRGCIVISATASHAPDSRRQPRSGARSSGTSPPASCRRAPTRAPSPATSRR